MPGKKPETKISSQHWGMILEAIYERMCVPFLGAAVNISSNTYKGLPLGPETARRLIGEVIGVDIKKTSELARVTGIHPKLKSENLAQDLARTWLENLPRVALHAEVGAGVQRNWLTKKLNAILDAKQCEPSPLLHSLAELPLRLIVTTNFDNLLERALDGAMKKALAVTSADILAPVKIAAALRQPPDAASTHLRAQLTPAVTAQIDAWDGLSQPTQSLIDEIAAELDRIAAGPSLYDAQRFPNATANGDIAPLVAKAPATDAERKRFNRLLLEEAFMFDLRRARRKYRQLVQPMHGFDEKTGKEHADNPPPDDVLTVYKLHGSFDTPEAELVITEDDYIEFLTVFNVEHKGIPDFVGANLRKSTLLFLGYSLEDWDFRTLYKAMVEPVPQILRSTSFAIQWDPPQFWVDYWDRKGVVIYNQDIHEFASELKTRYEKKYGSLNAAKAGA